MNTFEDQIKNSMADWQKRFEEMRVQFTQGKMDASESFEKYKEQLQKGIDHLKSTLDEAGDKAEEYTKDLRSKLEQLRIQLNLGKADGMDAFKEQREKIEAALHEVYVTGKSAYQKQHEHVVHLFENSSNIFKTGLEILQLQFALGKMDSKDNTEELRKTISEKMNQVSSWYKETQGQSMKNLEEWSKLAKENMEKMQSWSAEFMNSLKK